MFNNFPLIQYDNSFIVDIFRSADIVDDDTLSAYLNYDIVNGERPDVVSQRLYNSPDYYWTFFILNDELRSGGLTSWPLSSSTLSKNIKSVFDDYVVVVAGYETFSVNSETSFNDLFGIYPLSNEKFSEFIHIKKSNKYGKITESDDSRRQLWVKHSDFFNDSGKISSSDFFSQFNENENSRFNVEIVLHGDVPPNIQAEWNTLVRKGLIAHNLDPTLAQHPLFNYWEDAKNAPDFYLDANGNHILSYADIYDTLPLSGSSRVYPHFQTYRETAIVENEKNASIRVIQPQHIANFVREYNKVINE